MLEELINYTNNNDINNSIKFLSHNITQNNINTIYNEYKKLNINNNTYKEILEYLEETNSDILINLFIDKKPYIKELSQDKIINITGQSGSGKTTYSNNYKNNNDYLVIDTDNIFSNERYNLTTGINKELGTYFRNKYNTLPNCGDDFDLIYQEIINYCSKYNKTIVIDCAQFHCVKDINILKGTIVIVRTSINNCYKRCIKRYKMLYPKYTKNELNTYKEKKKSIYKWYKYSNEFIKKIDLL